ncbi:MAG: septum formation initiator [Blastomonas sp. CACIA14H2]|jgi:cell division protein FtsB|uniref:FtsB family cell division protein n=1 Tax=unclassified Blastomonas TaxID=2626550 RepID=UPI0003D0374A|nr:septum formation initiator family protein [Blastomonas sp. UPD001]ESZ88547.1 MAG: septum formation initiator [Blastomonas sp. CACIA14H2]
MSSRKPVIKPAKKAIAPGISLVALLAIAAYALLGPTGVLAWGDYRQRLEVQKVELARLQKQRDALRNRVNLLDPKAVDPDLVSELVRRELNVAHPDEVIVPLK